jgi:hypothetical protein
VENAEDTENTEKKEKKVKDGALRRSGALRGLGEYGKLIRAAARRPTSRAAA